MYKQGRPQLVDNEKVISFLPPQLFSMDHSFLKGDSKDTAQTQPSSQGPLFKVPTHFEQNDQSAPSNLKQEPEAPPQQPKEEPEIEKLPEAKKTKKRIIERTFDSDSESSPTMSSFSGYLSMNEEATHNIKKKLHLSDLIRTPTKSSQGDWPYELVLVRHGQSVS